MKLKLEIKTEFGTFLFGRVLCMDQLLRGTDEICCDADGYSIRSRECPAIVERTLYVQGRDSLRDSYAFHRQFVNADSLQEWCSHIKALVSKINNPDAEIWQ